MEVSHIRASNNQVSRQQEPGEVDVPRGLWSIRREPELKERRKKRLSEREEEEEKEPE